MKPIQTVPRPSRAHACLPCLSQLALVLLTSLSLQALDLKFAWPEGLRLRVECELIAAQDLKGKETQHSTRFAYTWTVSRHPDGLALVCSDDTLLRSEPASSLDPVVLFEHAARELSGIRPTLVVNEQGTPVALTDVDGVRERLDTAFAKIPGSDDALYEKLKDLFLQDDAIELRALEDWDRMVESWAGAEDVLLGEALETHADTRELVNGSPMQNTWILSVDQGPNPDLVVLKMIQRPDRDQLAAILAQVIGEDPLQALGVPADAEMVVEMRYVTLTDPQTLIPVRYTKEKIFGARAGSSEPIVGRTLTWNYTFTPLPGGTASGVNSTETASRRPQDAAELARVLDDVRRMVFALQDGDLQGILDLTHPRLAEMAGGADTLRLALEVAMNQMKDLGLTVDSYEALGQPEFFAHQGTEYVIVRTQARMTVGGKTVDSTGFMLGARAVGTSAWGYVDGSKLHGPTLQKIFPEFPHDRPLPKIERRLVQ